MRKRHGVVIGKDAAMLDMPNARYMEQLRARYEALKGHKLNLDMTRGKPCAEQLKLSEPLLSIQESSIDGIDCLNYGALEGLPAMRAFAARYLGTNPKLTFVLGNSSLQIMHDVVVQMRMRGGWPKDPVFLCPVPGYDRHHTICETYGIRMQAIPLLEHGPDMDAVRKHVKNPNVVGIWCVPKYSNPTGIVYSERIAIELALLNPACKKFTIMWDNAYAYHDLHGANARAPDIMRHARVFGTEDRVWIFGSLSKVTFSSAGLAFVSSSARNMEWFGKSLFAQTIGPDKQRQLQHLRFLKNIPGVRALMRKHRRIIEPKFKAVYDELEKGIGGKGIATWSTPDGGYFISLTMTTGSAKRVVELAKNVGLKLTAAGAAFPHGHDPDDSHIRIAPTFPDLKDVRRAAQVLAVCAELSHRESHPQTMRR